MKTLIKSKKRKKRLIVLSILALIIIVIMLFWPKPPKPPDSIKSIADLEAYMEKLSEFGSPPGMSLVVVKNDSIIYSKGFGWADLPRKKLATPQTVYHWWSLTKIVTAIAILQLEEQGKLQLDDSVAKHLPFFKVQYPSPKSKTITIRNLLTHSSGLPDAGFSILTWIHHNGEPPVNQTELVEKVLPEYSELTFEPGKDTEYTNIGYMVLGAIIEKVTNQTYEDYIRQNILKPLGMKHTDFIYTKEMEPFEAAGSQPLFDAATVLIPFICQSYVRETSKNNIWLKRVYTDQTPPTGLIGPATDAARLVKAYLNYGVLDSSRIFSEKLITKMNTESYIQKAKDPYTYFVRQGIGWQVYKGRNGKGQMLQHTGGGIGFKTIMQLYPDEKLGFILFSNGTYLEDRRIINLAATLKW